MSGPPPKRDDERRRANDPALGPADHIDVTQLPVAEQDGLLWRIAQPIDRKLWDVDENWHDIAKDWFDSLSRSGQAIFYEPSDWAAARLIAESMSRDLDEQVVGVTETGEVVKSIIPLKGASLAAYLKGFAVLGVTEGDRRRIRIEIENRHKTKGKPAGVVDIADKRKRHLS